MKTKTATFRFYEELNDFLPIKRRKIEFAHSFSGKPSTKDMIESLGVPHTEVDLILVNGVSVDFDHHVADRDRIAVYPVFESLDISNATHLRPIPLRDLKFIVDVNLGELAHDLRMLGFDTLYDNNYTDAQIVEHLTKENRNVLTRDKGVLKRGRVTHGYYVRSDDPEEQLKEVLFRFDLMDQIKPFTRCIDCNGQIESIEKKTVIDQIDKDTAKFFDEFFQCQQCKKVYWKGSHYENMQAKIESLKRRPI